MNYLVFDATMFFVGVAVAVMGASLYIPGHHKTHKWLFVSGVGLGLMLYVMIVRFLSGYE